MRLPFEPSAADTAESDTDDDAALADPPRHTDQRAAHLDRLAKISTSTSTRVHLGDHARNRQVEEGHRIEVLADPVDQHVSELDARVWNLMEQETLTFHGIGHLRWTDFEAYRDLSREAATDEGTAEGGPALGPLFRYLFNAGEDACVDWFLDVEFDLRDELILSYENLLAPSRQRNCLGAVEALGFGLLDHGFYNSGIWQSVLDGETAVVGWQPDPDAGRVSSFVAGSVLSRGASVHQFADRIESLMAEAKTEADGTRRAQLFYEFARDVRDALPGVEIPESGLRSDFSVGIAQQQPPAAASTVDSATDSSAGSGQSDEQESDDPGDDRESDDRDATDLIDDLCGGPDDADGEQEADSEDGESGGAGDDSEDEREPERGGDDGDESSGEDDGDDSDGASNDQHDDGDTGDAEGDDENSGGDEQSPPDPVTFETYTPVDTDEYEETLESQIQESRRERGASGDQTDAEKQVTHSFSGLDGGITVPEDWARTGITINEINECERQAQTIARILRATLQQERTSSRRYGTERGRLESSQLPYAVTGRGDIRSEVQASEAKEYSVQFILDRSISMRGSSIKHAQRAVYQLALGLVDVGAAVSVLSVYKNIPHLEVPFGADPADHRNRLFSAKTKGGTPLSHSLAVAKAELEDEQFDHNLILVVTDGYPDHEEAYREYVASLSVPVYGVYINETEQRTGDHDRYFDSVRYATPRTVDDRCRELCYDFVNHVG